MLQQEAQTALRAEMLVAVVADGDQVKSDVFDC
jgi:hypothetical protein